MRRLTDEHAVLRDHAERLLRQAFGDDDITEADERMAALPEALADRPHGADGHGDPPVTGRPRRQALARNESPTCGPCGTGDHQPR
jgi:hypothetical protein